jgi:hypothetical protein
MITFLHGLGRRLPVRARTAKLPLPPRSGVGGPHPSQSGQLPPAIISQIDASDRQVAAMSGNRIATPLDFDEHAE